MARYSGLSINTICRVINHAILNCQLIAEHTPGVITHSSLTRTLVEDKQLHDYVTTTLYELLPAGLMMNIASSKLILKLLTVKAAEALAQWPFQRKALELQVVPLDTKSSADITRDTCWPTAVMQVCGRLWHRTLNGAAILRMPCLYQANKLSKMSLAS
jgi:hypothetical protein